MRKFFTYTDPVIPVHHPRVLVETAVSFGAPREALFENSGLTEAMLTSPEMRVSYFQFAVLTGNALRLTNKPSLGLYVGRNTGIAQMGVLGFLIQNSLTIGAALDALIRYGPAVLPAWKLSLERDGDMATLVVEEVIPLDPFKRFAYEVILASIDRQTRTLYGERPLPVKEIEVPFAEPSYADEYRTLFYDVRYVWERPVSKAHFDAALLETPIAFADPATAKLAEHFCSHLLQVDASQEGLVGQMRRLLATETGVPPSLSEIARTLQTSTRTLRRELQNMGTSYKQLVDDSRRIRAEAWIGTNSMPIERLAANLGFSTVGSFRRAYKRWTGRTPGAEREMKRR